MPLVPGYSQSFDKAWLAPGLSLVEPRAGALLAENPARLNNDQLAKVFKKILPASRKVRAGCNCSLPAPETTSREATLTAIKFKDAGQLLLLHVQAKSRRDLQNLLLAHQGERLAGRQQQVRVWVKGNELWHLRIAKRSKDPAFLAAYSQLVHNISLALKAQAQFNFGYLQPPSVFTGEETPPAADDKQTD